MKYGYARVSTDGQSVDAQVRQLTRAGCEKVFRETASGVKTDRAQLRCVLAQLDAGDVLMVTRLDRLARSTRDLLNTLAAITGKKAGFRSLGDTWADITTAHGRLMLVRFALRIQPALILVRMDPEGVPLLPAFAPACARVHTGRGDPLIRAHPPCRHPVRRAESRSTATPGRRAVGLQAFRPSLQPRQACQSP